MSVAIGQEGRIFYKDMPAVMIMLDAYQMVKSQSTG